MGGWSKGIQDQQDEWVLQSTSRNKKQLDPIISYTHDLVFTLWSEDDNLVSIQCHQVRVCSNGITTYSTRAVCNVDVDCVYHPTAAASHQPNVHGLEDVVGEAVL
jgi:hypothetical protein